MLTNNRIPAELPTKTPSEMLDPTHLLHLLQEVIENVRIVDLGIDLYTKIEAVLNCVPPAKDSSE